MAEDTRRANELERNAVEEQDIESGAERQDLALDEDGHPNKHHGAEPPSALPRPTTAEEVLDMFPIGPVETPKANELNPKIGIDLHCVGDGNQAAHEGDVGSSEIPLRVSSSAFLASLTSASEIFSPLASGYPSSTSLQSSRASRDSIDDTSPSSPREKSTPYQDASDSGQEPTSSIESHSSSSTSTEAPQLYPDSSQTYPSQLVNPQASTSSVSVPLRTSSRAVNPRQNTHTSVSPSRSQRHLSAVSTTKSADHTPSERSPDPFLALPGRRTEGGDEDDHNRTPLLQATAFPEPKETHKLIKDSDSMGNKWINDYEILKRLGSGAHGTVKLGRNLHSRQHVAIKIVRRYPKKGRLGRQETPEDKVKKEVAVLKKARHPHVVSLLEVIDDHQYGKVYLILEYVERGEIIWRKQADRDISIFEMNRVRRELAGPVDDIHESDLLTQLNERLRVKQLENEAEGAELYQDPVVDENIEPLELTAQQTILGSVHGHHEGVREIEDHSRASSDLGNKSDNDNTPSPVQTVRVSSRNSMHDPHDALEQVLGGSQYGSYIEDDSWTQASDLDHMLDFRNEPSEWTEEEEEFRYVPCLTLSEARDVFKDTVLGLEYLHFHGIIHRDIKPANLLWTSNYRVKISDFGVSYLGRPTRGEDEADDSDLSHLDEAVELAKTVGTPAFYAPELCDPNLFDARRSSARPQITAQIDVWALGVTLYAMIFGRLPFYDSNEFAMYEKIARHEVFISSKRLRGVDAELKIPMNSNKREDYIVKYENVDETLQDLLKRLLDKNPAKRITLREVKHHPWVLEGVSDKVAWIDSTDPSLKDTFVSKIEISSKDVQEAVAPLNIMDRVKSGIRRFASVVRGGDRDSRKRAESSTNQPSSSAGASSRATTADRESRRPSLRGDELIYSAIRASRENVDHPLSQSTLASPEAETHPTEFVTPISYLEPSQSSLSSPSTAQRPATGPRSTGTTESIMTIKGHIPFLSTSSNEYSTADEAHRSAATESGGSSSSISRLITNTGLRLANRVRSRGPGRSSRENSNLSSRASSADNLSSNVEDGHVSASVALSPAMALGHVNVPPLTRDVVSPMPRSTNTSPELARQSSAESFQRPSTQQDQSAENEGRRRAKTTNWLPSSPEAESFSSSTQQGSLPDPLTGVFSSDEQLTSEASEPFSATQSIPSVGSRASSPPIFAGGRRGGYSRPSEEELARRSSSLMATGETITPAIMKRYQAQSHQAATEHDEAGYSADGDDGDDGDSDDEGVMMGGRESKKRTT